MISGQNSTATGTISGLIDKAGAKVAAAIQNASSKTGVDFSYLMQQAQIESSFKTDVKACSSSATGLYQFIDSTWLSMVNKYGDKYGIGDLANQINDNGKVSSNAVKKQILELRKDPELCSLMAAEMASDNKDYLEQCTGKEAGATELYMAHFMGPGGAGKFLKAMDKNPNANAATMFPTAAAANKGVFYDKSGNAKSLAQVYAQFDKKFSILDSDTGCTTAMAETLKPTTTTAAAAEVDLSNSNVLAALTPRVSNSNPPLYSKNSSLFTNDVADATHTTTKSLLPASMYTTISPVDVLEILKSQYTGHNTNA